MLEFAVIRFYDEIRSFINSKEINKEWTWMLKVKLILEIIIIDVLR